MGVRGGVGVRGGGGRAGTSGQRKGGQWKGTVEGAQGKRPVTTAHGEGLRGGDGEAGAAGSQGLICPPQKLSLDFADKGDPADIFWIFFFS